MRRKPMLLRRASTWRQISVALVLLVVAASCSSDATESEEYQSLEADHEELQETHRELETEKQTLEEQVQTLGETSDELREERQALEEELDTARVSLDEAEASLEEAQGTGDEPWPDEVKALFVEQCSAAPPDESLIAEGVSVDRQRAMCECTVEELSGTVAMADFMMFSVLAFSDAEAELDPLTGLPSGIDEEFAQTLVAASARCLVAPNGNSSTDVPPEDEQTPAELRTVDSEGYHLSVGECADQDQVDLYVDRQDYATVTCDEAHDREVFFIHEWPEGPYPGNTETEDELDLVCVDEFEGYVGTSYEASSLDIWLLLPGLSTWKRGQRFGECLLFDVFEAKLTGSARASGW